SPYAFGLSRLEHTAGFISGVEIHATTFLNLLRGDWIRRMSYIREFVLFGVVGALFGITFRLLRPWSAILLAFGGVGLVVFAAAMLFQHQFLWFSWLTVVTEIFLALALFLATSGFGYFSVERRKDG